MTDQNGFVEIQGTAEGEPFSHEALQTMIGLAQSGLNELFAAQQAVLAE